MNKIESNFGFKLMALTFNLRDLLRPRIDILKEAGIKPGYHVLDYGCGPGSYISSILPDWSVDPVWSMLWTSIPSLFKWSGTLPQR
jgi:hypothetical protein